MKKRIIFALSIFLLLASTCFAKGGYTSEVIDFKGKSDGGKVPEWVYDSDENKVDQVVLSQIIPDFNSKQVLVINDSNSDLKTVKKSLWDGYFDFLTNFIVEALRDTISQQLHAYNVTPLYDVEVYVNEEYGYASRDAIKSNLMQYVKLERDFWSLFAIYQNNKCVDKVYKYYGIFTIPNDKFYAFVNFAAQDIWNQIMSDY